jgi:hypothetical protein
MIVQKTVIVPKATAEVAHLVDEVFRRLVTMMDVNLNISDSLACHLRQRIKQLSPIFLLGIEETVLRSVSCNIPGSRAGDAGPCLLPSCHTTNSCLH